MNVIDSIKIGDTEGLVTLPYGVCNDSNNPSDEIASVTMSGNFELDTGTIIVVRFTNSGYGVKYLKVGDSDAKPIKYRNGDTLAGIFAANSIFMFIYDGTNWEYISDRDTNTTSSNTAHTHEAGVGLVLASEEDGYNTGGASGTVKYSIDIDGATAGQCLKINSNGNGVEWGTVSTIDSDQNVKQEFLDKNSSIRYLLASSLTSIDAEKNTSSATAQTYASSLAISGNTGQNLSTSGTITASSFNASSDARLKENFEEFQPEKSILDLPIYKFDFKDGLKDQIGCKAQDLQEICPEIVGADENGFLSIQESKLIYLLLDEVKCLKNQVNELSDKLAILL